MMQQDNKAKWIFDKHDQAHSELAFVETKKYTVIKHIIDRTFVDNHIRWIIDFKSATPLQNQSQQQFLEEQQQQYQQQLLRYAQCFKKHGEQLPIKCALYFPLCQLWIEWDAFTIEQPLPELI